MLSNVLMIITLTMATTIVLSSSPLNTGMWVMMTTLTMSATLTMLSQSWFPLLFFLIYLGGLLVMFAYFSAIMPNKAFKAIKMFATMTLLSSFLLPVTTNFTLQHIAQHSSNMSILELLLQHNTQTLVFLAIVLFLALVAVVKMTKFYLGPFRPFM